MINNQKADATYITGVTDKNEDEVKKEYSPKISPIRNNKKNSKTIEKSVGKKNKNIVSIVFPIIKPNHKNSNRNVFPTIQRYRETDKENNKDENIYKSKKSMSVGITKLRNRAKKYYYYNNNNDNSQSNNSNYSSKSLDNESKSNSINNSLLNNIRVDSAKEKNESNIKPIEYNINYENQNNSKIKNSKSKSPKRFNHLLHNDSLPKSQILNQKFLFKEKPIPPKIEMFFKKELEMEKSSKLNADSLEKYSPRLFHKKATLNNEYNNNWAENNDEYKIHTVSFKNQVIPYVEKIDVRKLTLNLPPIIIGSKFNLHERTEENIKKELFLCEIERIENERKKKKINSKELTKKEMLKMIKNKKLNRCNYLIHKTTQSIHNTKNKIYRVYNKLKKSLNQFDDWNDPKNVDNLYDN